MELNESKPVTDQVEPATTPEPVGAYQVLWPSLCFTGLLWFSFPPVGLWWLAWFAPIPLVWIILSSHRLCGQTATAKEKRPWLAGRPYRQLYLAGLIYWLATFYFIPIPHPALWVGWFVVSAYLAIYSPILIGSCRALIHGLRLPPMLAVPVVWTGIEWIRSHFATGMGLVCLSHSQFKHPLLIQVSDLFGGYTLTFLMVMVSTCLACLLANVGQTIFQIKIPASSANKIASAVGIVAALAAILAYGNHRLNESLVEASQAKLKLAIIQTSHDVIFGDNSYENIEKEIENRRRLTRQARVDHPDLDVVLWPESAFNPYYDLISDSKNLSSQDSQNNLLQIWSDATGYPEQFSTPVPLIGGAGTWDPANQQVFASVIQMSDRGDILKRYFKNHLVMVGEYVPLVDDWLPFLKTVMVIPSTTPGTQFESFRVNEFELAPNLCFESTVPHLIRRQLNSLEAAGTEPDAMLNLTNDGWFFGTSCLDFHLACNVFRSVEMRKPNLVCANTGFSAEIDTCGRIVQLGPRRQEGILSVQLIKHSRRSSLYREFGEAIPMTMGIVALFGLAFAFFRRR